MQVAPELDERSERSIQGQRIIAGREVNRELCWGRSVMGIGW
jgi:hypothetical protein